MAHVPQEKFLEGLLRSPSSASMPLQNWVTWLYGHIFNVGVSSYIQKSLSPFLEIYRIEQGPGSQEVLIWQMGCGDLGCQSFSEASELTHASLLVPRATTEFLVL